LDLVSSGLLNPGAIVTKVVSFDDAPEAMVEPAVKIVFVP
jgi:threonine dehydrogenase-like Zn-dependent dehydrogenase